MGRSRGRLLTLIMLSFLLSGCTSAILSLMGKNDYGSYSPYVNLEVPIEMLGRPAASSSTGPLTLNRSMTSLDTNDYDGFVSYFFEAVLYSTDAAARSLDIVDSGGNVRGGISIPPSAATYSRYRVQFTPNQGGDVYRVVIPQTTSDNDLAVYCVRILVNQVNATRTKIFIPLVGQMLDPNGTADGGPNGRSDFTTSGAFTQTNSFIYHRWNKKNSAFSQLAPGNAWSLEAVMSTNAGSTGVASLYNIDSGIGITPSAILINSTTPALGTANFAEGSPSFDDGSNFELKVRNIAGFTTEIYRAGLWVKLNPLQKGLAYYRLSGAATLASPDSYTPYGRIGLNINAFSYPKPTLSAFSTVTTPSDSIYLEDTGANASNLFGTTLFSSVVTGNGGASITENNNFSLAGGNNYHIRFTGPASRVYKNIFLEMGFGNQ